MTVAVFSIVMSRVSFWPGRVCMVTGKFVIVRGSSTRRTVVLVVHMYVAAMTVPSTMPSVMTSIMDMS